MQDRRKFLASLVVPFAVVSCTQTSESEKIARDFIQSYYVQMDLNHVLPYTEGLARDRIKSQIDLLGGQMPGAAAQIPTVDYKLLSQSSEGSEAMSYIFLITPKVSDIGKRKVYVKLRQDGKNWKVSQYTEDDQVE